MRIFGSELHLDGIVVDTAPIIWRDPARHEPPVREELLIIYREFRTGELLQEYCEWCPDLWRYVGDTGYLPADAQVLLWTYPPAIPALDEIERLAA